jgi:serine O-acetyltransferase
MFDTFRQDLGRYGHGTRQKLRALLFVPGVWAVCGYRFARWVETARMPRVVRKLLRVFATLTSVWVDVVTNIELPAGADIGPGLYIPHTGYIVLASGVRLGRNCTLAHGVTIGHGGGGAADLGACPVVGDRVYVGPGSAVIGPVTVGDDALIGVGAIVTRSVPPRGVAVGNPARVISLKGSFDVIFYEGRESDPARLASLAEGSEGRIHHRDTEAQREEGIDVLVESRVVTSRLEPPLT